jgi:membrane protease YdiL (CAAX protease family)
MNLAFGLLGLAIVGVWLPSVPIGGRFRLAPWSVLFVAACMAALGSGVLGVPVLLALALAAWGSRRVSSRWAANLLTVLSGVIALGLALHLFPGFHDQKLHDGLRLSADAAPFKLNLNFGKASAGLLLLAAYSPRIRHGAEAREVFSLLVWLIAIGTPIAVIGAALVFGEIRFDPKWPAPALAFLGANLLFTCVAEEAFFRGLLQERLHRLFGEGRLRRWLPVALMAALFPLLHLNGDAAYLTLVALAGFGYSLVYSVSRRIEAAVLTHFLVNATHFLWFTYPHIAK